MRVLAAIQLLRAGPFDRSTEAGRASERYRLATIAILANVLGRGLGMLSMVLAVSLTVPYLGGERFGVWMTILSFTTMLSFMDLGTGNALTNHVAQRAAQDEPGELRRAISGGLAFLAVIGLCAAILLFGIAALLPWGRLLKVSNDAVGTEARHAAMLFSALFGINIFSAGVQRVFAGLQRTYEAHFATAAGAILSIAGLWVASSARADVPTLLLVTLGSQILATLPLLALLRKRSQITTASLVSSARVETRQLLGTSSLFLLLQIGVMIGWGADYLIVSSTLGVAQVAIFSVTQRLLQFVSIPLSMINAPLWPAYADAQANHDFTFVRRTLKRSLLATMTIAIFGSVIAILIAQPLLERWTHGTIAVNIPLVYAFAIWAILDATGNGFAMFLNGCSVIRPQVISVSLFCIVVIPLKFILAVQLGVVGVVISTILGYLVAVPLLYSTVFKAAVMKPLGR